ncbi:S16 family serine protease, partial [Schlesneria sp.]|uniref:S16 family serine protease n=1 Tax=Schlesneria sp. TaxID=2762018 RepID=UPI002EFFE09E
TPELQSEDHIGRDPLPPGQVWSISAGTQDEGSGLYRIEVTEGPGSGVKILNRPSPPAFSESVKYAEANLYSRSSELVGDRNPREHEFSIQLRAYDAAKAGQSLGVAALMAMCSTLINRSLRGGLVVVGGLNLGGSLEVIHNAIDVVELAVEKGASLVLIPVSARKQLVDLSDEMATKVNVLFYGDVREAFVKAIAD